MRPGSADRRLTPGRIINLGRDRIHQPQACVSPKLQTDHNSSVFWILKTISFVFKIMQNRETGKWFVWLIMQKIDRGGAIPEPIPDLQQPPRFHFEVAAD